MALYTSTYPVLVYLVLLITSATRNTIVSGEAQQFDATILVGGCPVTDNEFMQIREDIRQQLIPHIEGNNVQPPTAQPTTEEVKPPPTTAPPPTTQPTTEAVTPPQTTKPTESPVTSPPTYTCNGTPGWRRVAFINMTDTSYNCPTGLNLTSHSIRTCGRANTERGCSSTMFSARGSQYSQVCGRIRGYQVGSTSAFYLYLLNSEGIDSFYVDGVSLTHGAAGSRQHIWTFAAGLSENDRNFGQHECPCDNKTATSPPFIGNDYFCESGINGPYPGTSAWGVIYPNDTLWDGQDCLPSSTCCTFNNPPWFTKTLPSSTTDDIELRVCLSGMIIHDDTPIELIEIYIK